MSVITTHILDTTKGKPAQNVAIILYKEENENWIFIAEGTTNTDGRIADLLAPDRLLNAGIYKMKFMTGNYFDNQNIRSFYPYIEIIFSIKSGAYYHIPLLLNPFGYTTYRGS